MADVQAQFLLLLEDHDDDEAAVNALARSRKRRRDEAVEAAEMQQEYDLKVRSVGKGGGPHRRGVPRRGACDQYARITGHRAFALKTFCNFDKAAFDRLAQRIAPLLSRELTQLNVHNRLLFTLMRLKSGSSMAQCTLTWGVSQATLSQYEEEIMVALDIVLTDEFQPLPTDFLRLIQVGRAQRRAVPSRCAPYRYLPTSPHQAISASTGFPEVHGLLDCTYFLTDRAPAGAEANEKSWSTHRGVHCATVLTACDLTGHTVGVAGESTGTALP